jgi:hypothetical protein
MFTGFASENTPAIQVWDFSPTSASTSAVRSVYLQDDCAPVQFFQTGGTSTALNIYLPSSPIEGKQIKIINTKYGANSQQINIFSSDRTGAGTNIAIYIIGPSGSILLTYSKNLFSIPSTFGTRTGWLALDQASTNTDSQNSVLIGGSLNIAAGLACTVIGGQSNTNNSFYGSIIGGSTNFVSNNNSSVVGGSLNTASSTNAAVVGGSGNTASGSGAAIVGGVNSAASGTYSAVLGGNANGASGQSSCLVGGQFNSANAANSGVFLGLRGTVRAITSNTIFTASSSPIAASDGVSQSALLVLGRQTTDATATVLRSDTGAASTTNQVILPNNSAYTFQGTCIANVTAGGTTSGWKFEGVIKRGANAASTVLVAAVTPTVIAQDAGAATWVLAITADTTNGGIAVTVTGAAATTIRWVAKIETTEVTF